MAQVPPQLARMAGAPSGPAGHDRPRTARSTAGSTVRGTAGSTAGSTAVSRSATGPQVSPRPSLLAVARASVQDLVRWGRLRRVRRHRPA